MSIRNKKWKEFPSWLKGGFLGLLVLFIPYAFALAVGLPIVLRYSEQPDNIIAIIYDNIIRVLGFIGQPADYLY